MLSGRHPDRRSFARLCRKQAPAARQSLTQPAPLASDRRAGAAAPPREPLGRTWAGAEERNDALRATRTNRCPSWVSRYNPEFINST